MNTPGRIVRKRRGGGTPAGPATAAAEPPDDRRVRRTTRALIQALVDLALEKRYDTITVQDLLERADVGRSTFYAHYRGKDDLVLRSFERMLEGLDRDMAQDGHGPPRLAPVREIFRHVGGFNRFHRAMARGGMLERIYQAGTDTLSRTIAARLPEGASALPPAVVARALAGALFALLRDWIDEGERYTPEQMDDMFHALLPGRGPTAR